MIIGIESTAHTFGIGIVRDGKILANVKKTYTTISGGIIPAEAAKHHRENAKKIYEEALAKAEIKEKDIDAIAFSQGPGLAPCLLEGMKFAKELALKLKKPLVPVNHCIAHLEIGELTGAKNPVMLYVSGANTQIIAYASGKYRIFGETLDIGVGNFIDNFARFLGLGFPGGAAIQKLAEQGKNYVELPYCVKGMDITLSGILTNLKQKVEKMNMPIYLNKKNKKDSNGMVESSRLIPDDNSRERKYLNVSVNLDKSRARMAEWLTQSVDTRHPSGFVGSIPTPGAANYTIADLCYSMQETVFAMLVETAERALAHTGKKELLLGGGVACNTRLQEMCKIMCSERINPLTDSSKSQIKERGSEFFCPENSLLVDNGAMIAYLGEIMFKKNIKVNCNELDKIDIKSRQRTDEVDVEWR